MTGIKCLLVLCLIIAATHCENSDLTFENEGPKKLDREESLENNEDDRFLGKMYKFKDKLLGSLFDYNIFSSTPAAEVKEEETKSKTLEAEPTRSNEVPRLARFKRASPEFDETYDDEDIFANSGSGVEQPSDRGNYPMAPGKYTTARITFVVREPYEAQFSNRDSVLFQNLSRNLADGVSEIFDRFPGEHRARLVRIQSRPEDTFTCKVTLEISSLGYTDVEKIILEIKNVIKSRHRLGNLTVSAEEFHSKVYYDDPTLDTVCAENEQHCRSDGCFRVDKRCDGVKDCVDESDEEGCDSIIFPPIENDEREWELPNSGDGVEVEETGSATESPTEYPEQATMGFPDLEPTITYPEESSTVQPDVECNYDEFSCDVSRCISLSARCDGYADCSDETDEEGCGRCKIDDFVCDDGQCIEKGRHCNSVVDCRNGEDELNCPCLPDEFRCVSDGVCIELRKRCDNEANCRDSSDESGCPPVSENQRNTSWSGVHVCNNKGQFLCRDGTCISVLFRCDGKVDCPKDTSDESDCPCTSDQWQCDFGTCIAKNKRCDGRVDCPSDRSDERHCSDRRHCMWPNWNEYFCKVDQICIPLYLRCDGKYDCSDMTDEKNCPCKKTEFECSFGACILLKHRCDGIVHCQNGADEIGCTAKPACNHGEFRCSSGNCIHSLKRCDKVKDCDDGSDESECGCTREQYRCRRSKKCIEIHQLCDNKYDCPRGDDERHCANCGKNEYHCGFEECIPLKKVCDGVVDCLKNSADERLCSSSVPAPYFRAGCDSDSFTCQSTGHCISRSEVCNGVEQCPNGEDEANCPELEDTCDIRCGDGTCLDNSKRCDRRLDCSDGADERDCECGQDEFSCADGSCINGRLLCNGIADCTDNSDEYDCPAVTSPPTQRCEPQEFHCDSGECISEEFRCDQNPDCVDSSDEKNCPEVCEDNAIQCDGRCVPESYICDGTKDCSDGRDEQNCVPESGCASFEYECNDHSCIHFYLVCNGHPDCRDGSDERDCDTRGCSSDEWQCTSGECVKKYSLCDGRADCQDGSDEREPTCKPVTSAPTRPPYVPPVTQRPTWEPPEEGGCRRNEWRCENGPCIHASLRCNGRNDCPYDNSDELDCSMSGGGLNLKTYPNDQIIKQNPYPKGGEVVFQCRDEGPLRAPVKWVREGDRPLPAGSTDRNGRLEMPNIQVTDSGIYICQAVGYPRYTQGSELSVRLTVEPYSKIDYRPAESCKINEATCSNGDCIPKNQVCNGHYDCTDGSDELACNIHGICEPNEFKCANKRCILKTWVCDSEDDCKDGSDEVNCGVSSPGDACLPYEFQCKTVKQCISRSFHCDGQNECLDGSDEVGCSPVFISRPPPPMMILEEHSTMVITCIAHGVPSPEVVWRLNWGHIPEKCSYTSVNGVGTLTCPDVRVEDQGAYSCEALNNRGSVFAVPDTILVINSTKTDVCPAGYFNSEARVAQECISCFCFGATTECRSAELFTYQLPPPLSRSGIQLMGVTQQPGQPLQITDEPISDIFDLQASDDRGITITRIGQWSPRNIYPYLALSENHLGTQLKSYGGYIKYTVRPNSNYPAPQGYIRLPDIIIKGGNILLTHIGSRRPNEDQTISVRLFQGQWQKVTPYGPQTASREDIMMVLANIDALLLRAEDNGSGVEINNFQMDTAGIENYGQGLAAFVEECKCPQGYSGLSCQKCSPGFTRVESGRWLGRCTREEETSCQAGYYGNPSAGVPCRLCPCPLTNPGNQFSRTCSLAGDGQVTCNCPTGYLGRRCEMCAPGYVGNPMIPGDSCRPAPPPQALCDPRGTSSQNGDECRCKPNVVGPRCSECAPESFHLSDDNIFGCSQCFCMGVTRTCSSSTMRRNKISAKFASQSAAQSINLIEWSEQPEDIKTAPSEDLIVDPSQQQITYNNFPGDFSTTFYWQLPDRFAGEKLTAYGGYLNYTIRHISSAGYDYSNNSPDIQLISNNDIVLAHFSGAKPDRNGIVSESVQLLEQYWQRADGMAADREHMLMTLANLQSVIVKATYTSDTRSASLISASLDIADERGVGPRASHVEECQCPQGYLGTSCQECAPGYKRTLEGLYLGFCSLCSCNEHSDECHPETGDCLNCQHNTYGPSCEYCLPGYKGNATNGTPGDCRPDSEGFIACRCDERGTMEPFCDGRDSSCRCKQNVEGERCDRCRPGTYKLSKSDILGCTSCYCSGVTESCSEAQHLYKQQIPIGIIDDSHGFVLSSLDRGTLIDSNFQLDVPMNQISYNFGGGRNRVDRLFWSLPNAFTGNKLTSYGGNITITQKFDSANGYEASSDDIDIVIVGRRESVYWKNPRRLMSGIPSTYSVQLNENLWYTLSSGEAPRPISHHAFMDILADIQLILVRAALSPYVTQSSIGDVAMDIAVPGETGQSIAENIELCRCPLGYSGTSCEACSSGYYRTSAGSCAKCPCSGREEACRLGQRQSVICDCRPGYTGYDCSSIDYGNSTEAPPVTYPPTQPPTPSIRVIISAPTIENKPVGGSVQFICTARSVYSSAPIRVSWSKEGGSLPLGRTIEDSSRGLLAIRDLKVTDSGTYICQASDGTSTGYDRASLTVPSNQMVPPQITLSPPMIEVYEGEPIEIRCQVTGSPTPTLTWAKVNRRTMNAQHTFTEGIFRISSARPSDQGDYRCFATNPYGQDSKVAVVYVNPRSEGPARPPVLSVNPSQPVIREGDSLTIVCSADHSVPPNFIKWTREDGFLPPNFRSQNGQLWMDSVRNEDAGVYLCSADQFPSRVIPANVVITVQRIPQQPPVSSGSVTVDNSRVIIPEGQSFTIKCTPRGSPLPIIKWTKEGSEFEPGVTQRGNALVFNQAKMSDRGAYYCLGNSVDGVPIAQGIVYVDIERREVPEVIVWPEGVQTVRPGGSARLQCRVMKGAPDPIVTWSRPSGRPLTGDTHLMPDGILSFTGITVNEEGIYTCTGSNVAGEHHANATIKLQSPPVLSISPDTYINAQAGSDVTMECRADGYPEPIVHWVQITPEEKILTTDHSGTVSFTLRSVVVEDEGTYACVARNEAGIQEERVSVVIADNEIDSYPQRGDIPGPLPPRVSISSSKFVTKYIGDSLRIDCKGSGRVDRITWRKLNSREYLNVEDYPGSAVLILDQIGVGDSGTYVCEGFNRDGPTTTDEIVLEIVQNPNSIRPSGSTSVSNSNSNNNNNRNDWQSEDPQVVSARLGSTVLLPCTTNLPTPVTFQWIRPHTQLPSNVVDRSPTLRLVSINETDAGPYICRVSHNSLQMESRKILRVTHILPKFAGDGYIALKPLTDAYLYIDIEVSIKPQDYNGIILYSSVQPSGNMVSIALVDGIPEFRFVLSRESTVIIRGDRPLSLEEWHTIKIIRRKKDGYMYVDGSGPFTGSSTTHRVGIDLSGPLYVGGVPDVNQLPEDFKPRTGFVGCIGRLLLENADVTLMREAIVKENTEQCDTCNQNPCLNNGVCQESLTQRGYTCLCPEGYSGRDCAGTGESCMPGICGPGQCTETNEQIQCACPVGYAGQRCESKIDIEYPAFGGRAFLAFAPPTAARHLKVSMRVKPTYPMKDGLILYSSESRYGRDGDFTSLALKNGYLDYRYSLGGATSVLRSREPLTQNKWVNVTITRRNTDGQLSVEGQETVTGRVDTKKTFLQLKTPLYIGGYDSEYLTVNQGVEVNEGFVGCISDVKLSEKQLDIKESSVKSANVHNCGDNDSEYRPHRGDIPETSTIGYSGEFEGVCSWCQNGGYCERPGDQECICQPGYEGTYCETAVSTESQYSPCDRQPCENGGTCRPTRNGSLYRCDCPKGTGGFQCRQRVDLNEDVSLAGEGYVELPAYLLPHNEPKTTEVIAVAFTTSASDGLLVFQGDNNTNPRDGDFVMLNINGGFVELQWDLGGGVGTIQNSRVLVSDNQRHQVVVKRTGLDAVLEVDRVEDHGRAPGMTTMLNADSNIYVGGVPSHLTQTGIIGFSGCIHQIEFQDSRAIHFGSMAVASRNANPCSNDEENNVNEDEFVN